MNDNDKQHIEAICRRHDIRIFSEREAIVFRVLNDPDYVSYSVSFSASNPVTGEKALYVDEEECETEAESYYVGLHEIGHQVLGHIGGGTPEQHVEREIEAWEWAIAHAQYPPNDAVIIMIINALSTYTDMLP